MAFAKREEGISDVHVVRNSKTGNYECNSCCMNSDPDTGIIYTEVCETVYAIHYHLRVHAKRGHLVPKHVFRKLEKHLNKERKADVTVGRKERKKAVKTEKEKRRAARPIDGAVLARRLTSGGSIPTASANSGKPVSTGR